MSSQLWLCMAGYINYISFTYIFTSYFFSMANYAGQNWTIWCGYVWRDNSCPYIFLGTIIWLMSHFLSADNRPGFHWNVDNYGGRSHLYLLKLWIWIIYCFIDIHDVRAQSQVPSKGQLLFIDYVQINMSQICTFSTKIQGYHLYNWCDVLGIYSASSRMWQFPTYFEDGRMLESVLINSR